MKIFYVYPEELPSKKARAISVINSAYEISKKVECTLLLSDEQRKSKDEIVSFYNLNSNSLKIEHIKKRFLGIKSNLIFNKNLLNLTKNVHDAIFYVRHLKTAKYLIMRKKSSQKIIFECHEIFEQTMKEENPEKIAKIKTLHTLEEFVYKHCDGLVFSNQTLQKYFNDTFSTSQKKQIVAYNGMNFDELYIKKDFSNINELFYIGNFFQWKGVQDAIKVVSLLDNIKLTIIGGDSKERTEELKTLIENLNIENKVSLLGYKQTSNIKNILQNNAKLTVIPNTKSIQNKFSMPIKLYEYMATSNIVIAVNMETIQEIIIDGYNGFLFESGNIESFKSTLEKVLSMQNEILQEIAKNAYETSKKFTWEQRALCIINFLKDILNNENLPSTSA